MSTRVDQQNPSSAHAAAKRGVGNLGPGQMEEAFDVASEKNDRFPLHPASGLVILGLDWILFGGTVATGGLGFIFMCMIGFLLGGGVITLVQKHLSSDDFDKALGKGVVGGLLIGVPTPIVGSIAGVGVVAVSGLTRLVKGGRR